MPIILDEQTNLTSKTEAQDLLKVRIGQAPLKATVIIINSHAANTIQYRLDYSNDREGADSTWYEKQAWTDVAPYADNPANAKQHDINPTPLYIRVQIKTKTGTSHGTADAWLKAAGT